MRRRSHYLTMRDGVRIAVDVTLPDRVERPLPTILHQTRYMRSIAWRRPLAGSGLERLVDSAGTTRARLVGAGYAWVDVDVRGSGASGGSRPCPWWRDEVADGGEVVDWIVRQPFSDGHVGATGVSYAGTSAEMLLINQHPAVLAAAPRFSLYDVYPDVAFPGGAQLSWFTESWAGLNRHLDDNAFHRAFATMIGINGAALADARRDAGRPGAALLELFAHPRVRGAAAALFRLAVRGVRPVGLAADADLAAAVADHAKNSDVHVLAGRVSFRDDRGAYDEHPEETVDGFSPHAHAAAIAGSGAAVMSYSGWLDGAYCNAAVKRFLSGGSRWLLLGPWDHGGRQQISPHEPATRARFDHDAELVRFFDRHLRGADIDIPPVRYFTMGAERWRTAPSWPPPNVETHALHLAPGRALRPEPPAEPGADAYRVAPGVGSGRRSRWRSLLGVAAPLGYGDRARLASRLLCYTSAPLPDDLIVTGHPVVHLELEADAEDGAVFAYLEEVEPGGRAIYVTEGQLRLIHRREAAPGDPCVHAAVARRFVRADAAPMPRGAPATCRFELYPVSYRFRRGSSVRLSLAGADADHFAPIFRGGETMWLHRGPNASRLELPVET